MVSGEPRQASLRRLRRYEVRPNRELGQNFLIDDNILGVIGRAAELDAADVVLEVGGGLGVLSEYLAPRVSHLHVVEVDRALAAPLEEALEPYPNTTLHLADAVRLDFAALAPAPDKVVANLPYGVAATVLLKSIVELPGASLWVAMVQREVGDRLAAAPGGRAYGASSVLAQLACEVRFLRRVPRTVFHPEPNVESALVLLRRRAPAATERARRTGARRLRPPPQGAGGLARARARRARGPQAGGACRTRVDRPRRRRPGRAARPGRVAPPRGRARAPAARRAGRPGPAFVSAVGETAYAKLNLALQVGRPRADGLHPVCSLFASIDLADELWVEAGGTEDRVECPGVAGPNLAAAAIAAYRARVPELPALHVRIDKRIPVAAGLAGGSADAAAVLRAADRIAGAQLGAAQLRELAAGLGSDVPSQVEPPTPWSRAWGRSWRRSSFPARGRARATGAGAGHGRRLRTARPDEGLARAPRSGTRAPARGRPAGRPAGERPPGRRAERCAPSWTRCSAR